jgi:hypothetical protein
LFVGGNQRELARLKNQKKQQEQQKRKGSNDKDSNKGLTLEQRKQRHVSGRRAVSSNVSKIEWHMLISKRTGCSDAMIFATTESRRALYNLYWGLFL